MAKQKIVIKVSMNNKKSRSKAMQIAVGISGVEGAAIEGESRDQIVVNGEGIDSVKLTCQLRKRFSHADLVSVNSVENEEEKKEEEKKKEEAIVTWPYNLGHSVVPHYPVLMNSYQYEDPYCSIM